MTSRSALIFTAISGFIFVAPGAFDAHMLSRTIGAVEMGRIQTSLEYQAFHTSVVSDLAVATQRRVSTWFYWNNIFPVLGMVPPSDSLYCLTLSHLCLWTFVTPVGDVNFLVGWALMLVGVIHLKRKDINHK